MCLAKKNCFGFWGKKSSKYNETGRWFIFRFAKGNNSMSYFNLKLSYSPFLNGKRISAVEIGLRRYIFWSYSNSISTSHFRQTLIISLNIFFCLKKWPKYPMTILRYITITSIYRSDTPQNLMYAPWILTRFLIDRLGADSGAV